MINILIFDSQPLTNTAMQQVLAQEPNLTIVGVPSNFPDIQTYSPDRYDILLADPYIDGHVDLASLGQVADLRPVVMISDHLGRAGMTAAKKLGIRVYLSKYCTQEELLQAIYAASRGDHFYCEHMAAAFFHHKIGRETPTDLPLLSPREAEVVSLIAKGKTNSEIASFLFLSIHTVKTHRKNIIKKLGFTFKSIAELTEFIDHNLI